MSRTLTDNDQDLVRQAVGKLKKGEKLTERESRAHKKASSIQENEWREKIYRDVPQKDFAAMCGGNGRPKQTKQLQDFERVYRLPFAGSSVDLFEFMPKLWDRLSELRPTIKLIDEMIEGDQSNLTIEFLKARTRKMNADADVAELRVAERQRLVVERSKVHLVFEQIIGIIHAGSDTAQATWGVQGYEFIAGLVERISSGVKGVINGPSSESAAAQAVDSAKSTSRHARRRDHRTHRSIASPEEETDS